jgi:hypothetical protein
VQPTRLRLLDDALLLTLSLHEYRRRHSGMRLAGAATERQLVFPRSRGIRTGATTRCDRSGFWTGRLEEEAGLARYGASALLRFWISAIVAASSAETLIAKPLPAEVTLAFTPLSSSGQ